ncbi:MAG: nickel-responsive transcriptional regulator NikR [Planctomycetes bacterium]|nr:nickel-responsive transcriptional regulator NikR [Planctomycetota bacterium]
MPAKPKSHDTLDRFGVSMDRNLLRKFDQLIAKRGYNNRSEAIRDLVRAQLVRESWQSNQGRQVAVLSLFYEHEHGDLLHRLTHLQHEHQNLITASFHIHLDSDNCMEVLILQGQARDLEQLAERLLSIKGVKFGELMHGTTGKNF